MESYSGKFDDRMLAIFAGFHSGLDTWTLRIQFINRLELPAQAGHSTTLLDILQHFGFLSYPQAIDYRHDIARTDGEEQTRKGGYLDRQDVGRETIPACHRCHGQQIRPDHLGDAHQETGI